ncbi:MAG TPA: fumarylacetoacetate hydrolase family protein [Gaiellaceae bacterium]|nr:fumarylacetoacetate hydrolase family protein [Gaiellaceae bacterium]
MRVGSVSDGMHGLVAVQEEGRWFAVDGASSESVVDVLTSNGRTSPLGPQPLPASYRPTVPVRPPRNVMCLGKNFRAHAEEFAAYAADDETVPAHPIVFTKAPEALCGAHDTIEISEANSFALDYEVELGVVIGRAGAAIAREDAAAHVAGYTIVNDITARDLQERHRQWFLAKSLPHATPIGPVVVTPDELGELDDLQMTCHVNDELRQSARLGEMVFGVAQTIAIISAIGPLERGDIISMGTPSGVGIGFTPPRFLEDGDTVVCAIEGIGELRNVIRVVA